ncbi:hypothetical protein LZ30DRAFT_730547 [Colletotrichum cereale]|nr:hypothetical protein LZ30DRAFT_730547 [Colletotrichum cereale]
MVAKRRLIAFDRMIGRGLARHGGVVETCCKRGTPTTDHPPQPITAFGQFPR